MSEQTSGCPWQGAPETFDPFCPAFMDDPAEYARWAREQLPIFFAPHLGYWVVTRYRTIKEIFRDPITFSPSVVLEPMTPLPPQATEILKSYGYAFNRTLVNEDEPVHMQRRRVLMAPFTPEHLAPLEPKVRRMVRERVDRFIDRGEADLVDELLWPVPFDTALQFLGVDDEDRDKMRRFSIAHTVNAFGRPSREEQLEVVRTVGEFWRFAGEVLERMRATPDGPGWMRYSIRMQKQYPEVVTDSYLHSMMQAIIVAAHETTAFAGANAMRLLLSRPQAWRALCEDPALISPAIEECLRHSGSLAAWRRRATRPVTVEGQPLPAGAKILMVVAAANRDPRQFPDPDAFDPWRANAVEHLTFGFGAHQCLGKNLARMELQIMLEELTRRLPHLQLVPRRFEFTPNISFRGPQHLWVRWDPARNPERRDRCVLTARVPVRIGAPLARSQRRALQVAAVREVAAGVKEFTLVDPNGRRLPPWEPGAHVEVACGNDERWRAYSLCGDPADRSCWRIAVLRDAASRGGSVWMHEAVEAGSRLRVVGPKNRFRFEPGSAEVLLIAGGIGITPILPMAAEARARGLRYRLHYCGRTRAAMAYLDELAAQHGDALVLHVSDEGTRADFAALLAVPRADAVVYACGPARMLDAVQQSMRRWPEGRLHVEHFAAEAPPQAADEQPFTVELKISGLTLQVPAGTRLLDALRAANIDVASDCEEGLCGTCEVPVLEGEILHRDHVLSPAERAEGRRMMSCCSRAAGGKLVLNL